MRLSAPLEYPSGRHLAGWWKQLGPTRPGGLWVAHLLLHQVEALFRTSHRVTLEPLSRLILEAVSPGETAMGLVRRLGVRAALVAQLLWQLHREGLVEKRSDGSWSPTDLGRNAREHKAYPREGQDRWLLHFVENESERPPHFLRLGQPSSLLPVDPGETTFELQALTRCLEQAPDWKHRHGFPMDVAGVVTPFAPTTTVPPWQAVILDRPGYLAVALVRMQTDQGEQLIGYPLEPATWSLQNKEPLFSLGTEWPDVFPDLCPDPPLAAWHSAWSAWGLRRGLPTVEMEACVLEHQVNQIRVRAPARLLERLRAARSDALKGEAWLLAGTGRARMAARIELHS